MIVDGNGFRHAAAVGGVKYRIQAVGIGFVRAKQTEVLRIELDHVAKVFAQLPRRLGNHAPGLGNFQRVIHEVGQRQRVQEAAAVRHGIRTHAQRSLRRDRLQGGVEIPFRVEELLRLVASHPFFEKLELRGVLAHRCQRNLVRAESAFDGESIDLLRPGPAFRRAQDDHRPQWDP